MLAMAKAGIDIGLATNRWEDMRAFYEGAMGLAYQELLPIGGGVRQHRLGLLGSVLKINDTRDPLADAPTGYTALYVADDGVAEPERKVDPDGLDVVRVPRRHRGVEEVGVEVSTADPDAYQRFVSDALGADEVADGAFRLGSTMILVRHDRDRPRAGAMQSRGFRYVTIQVRDVIAEHARLMALGVEEGMPPRKLGEVAMICFVRDPGGNWIEISQRASLTGPLPDAPSI